MCLAIPAQIVELLPNHRATVNVGGVHKEISLALLAQTVAVDDFVIIHVGFALNKLDEEDAQKTLRDFSTMLHGQEA